MKMIKRRQKKKTGSNVCSWQPRQLSISIPGHPHLAESARVQSKPWACSFLFRNWCTSGRWREEECVAAAGLPHRRSANFLSLSLLFLAFFFIWKYIQQQQNIILSLTLTAIYRLQFREARSRVLRPACQRERRGRRHQDHRAAQRGEFYYIYIWWMINLFFFIIVSYLWRLKRTASRWER